MNDLDLLKRLPGLVHQPDDAAKDRMRSLMDARIGQAARERPTSARPRRRSLRIGVIAAAAVLVGAAAASAVADHLWTTDQPVAIPTLSSGLDNESGFGSGADISDPKGLVDPTTLPSTVAEFAPSIRLPEGGSYDEWVNYATANYRPEYSYESTRSNVAFQMVLVAQCQWMQQWLTATETSNDAQAAQVIRVLPGINTWLRGAGLIDGGSSDTLVKQMKQGDVAHIQSAENQCAYRGSWGSTVSEQDAKATGDLAPAIQIVRSFLSGGGAPADFSWHTGDSLAHLIRWTDPAMQPAPIFPGDIYIAPTTEDGVMLISPSESGTRFCAVINDTTVERGTVDPERYPPDPNSLNTPFDPYPGPVACTPGGWPG